MSSLPARNNNYSNNGNSNNSIPHAPRPHMPPNDASGGGATAAARKAVGGRKYVASGANNASSHSALPSHSSAAAGAPSSSKSTSNARYAAAAAEAKTSAANAASAVATAAADELASAQRMLEMLAQERSFMMKLLDQAKQERQELLDTIAQRDATIQRKDAELTKMAQRAKAEEQAFRDTMAAELDRMEDRRVQEGRHSRTRDALLDGCVGVLVAAEVFSSASGGYVSHILKILQAMPSTRVTAEDACNRFITGQDTTATQKQFATYLLHKITEECNTFEAKRIKTETARALRRKAKKGKRGGNNTSTSSNANANNYGDISGQDDSLDEDDDLGQNSVSSTNGRGFAYATNMMSVGAPQPAMPPYYDVNSIGATSTNDVSLSPTNSSTRGKGGGNISSLMNAISAGRYLINNLTSFQGVTELPSDGDSSNYSKLLEESADININSNSTIYTGGRSSIKAGGNTYTSANPTSTNANTTTYSSNPTAYGSHKQVSFHESVSGQENASSAVASSPTYRSNYNAPSTSAGTNSNAYYAANITTTTSGTSNNIGSPTSQRSDEALIGGNTNTSSNTCNSSNSNNASSPDGRLCGPDPSMMSCFPMFSSRSPAPTSTTTSSSSSNSSSSSSGLKTSVVSTNFRSPSKSASSTSTSTSGGIGGSGGISGSGYDNTGSVALGEEDYYISDASTHSEDSVASNVSASKGNNNNKEYWWKSS